jgi:hypothetical protein
VGGEEPRWDELESGRIGRVVMDECQVRKYVRWDECPGGSGTSPPGAGPQHGTETRNGVF